MGSLKSNNKIKWYQLRMTVKQRLEFEALKAQYQLEIGESFKMEEIILKALRDAIAYRQMDNK